jgi:hypothetical protein
MTKKQVFIVHGRDKLPAYELAFLLQDRYDCEAIILEETASEGKTLIEKLEEHSEVDFAFVILTADDVGGLKNETLKERARQNVIYEWGHFEAKIGRKRMALLVKGNVEIPSDLRGVGYYRFRDSVKECFIDFEKDLKKAGLFETNKIPSEEKQTEKGEDKEYPKSRDMYFDFGLDQKISRIDWNDFTELEIQGILRQYFASLGYAVDWKYMMGRSEKHVLGCDLLCTKNGRTTDLLVIKTLKTEVFAKLRELLSREYTERICVFVNQPSPTLRNKLISLTEELKLINIRVLEHEMQDSDVGSQILCMIYYSNSEFVGTAIRFVYELNKLTQKTEEVVEIIKKPMAKLWQLKDYSVSMEKSLEALLTLLDEPAFYTNASFTELMHVFKQGLEILNHCMYGFNRTWKELVREDRNLIRQTHAKYGSRSNWLSLWTYGGYFVRSDVYSPGILMEKVKTLEAIDKDTYEQDEVEFAALSKNNGGREYVPTPLFSNFVREEFLRPHFAYALALENTVDQMFEL